VNAFEWQINCVESIKSSLNCYRCLEKFNTILCAKHYNRPLLAWIIPANVITLSKKAVTSCRQALT